jgi:hypothetical protein
MRGETVTRLLYLLTLGRVAKFADFACIETGVGPGLRRDDVEGRHVARHIRSVMPAKAGTHASFHKDDAGRSLVRQRNAESVPQWRHHT